MRQRPLILIASVAASLSIACHRHEAASPFTPSSAPAPVVQDFALSVSTADGIGTLRAGAAPSPAAGPRVTASGNQSIVNGGTLTVAIQSASPFTTVYMFVGAKALGLSAEEPGGIAGYYDLRLPASQTSATVLLTFPQTIPVEEFELLFAVADPSGLVGPYTALTERVTHVGTGDVQVTLSWDVDSDVDIHVIDPSGAEIYYGEPTSASGGELDLDSNAACRIDGVRNENITWPIGRAPGGTYTVRVDYWDSCGVGRTNFTVRINSGGSTQIVSGFFTGTGDGGGLRSGRTVATFERPAGSSALTLSRAPDSAAALTASSVVGKKMRSDAGHAPN